MPYNPRQYGTSGFGDAAGIVNDAASRRANILGTTQGYNQDLLNSLIGGYASFGNMSLENKRLNQNNDLTRENFSLQREQNALDRKNQLIAQLVGATGNLEGINLGRDQLAEGGRQFDLNREDENNKFALAKKFDETKRMAEEERFKKELENRQQEAMLENFFKSQGLSLDKSQLDMAREKLANEQKFNLMDYAARGNQFTQDMDYKNRALAQEKEIAQANALSKNADDNAANANTAYEDPSQASALAALDPMSRAASQSGIANRLLTDIRNSGRSALEDNLIGRGEGFSPSELLTLKELITKQLPALQGSNDPNVAVIQQILSGLNNEISTNSPRPVSWFDIPANNIEKLFTNTKQIPQDRTQYIRQLLGI